MRNNRRNQRIEQMSIDEATFISRIASMLEYRKELIPSTNGSFMSVTIQSRNKFDKDDIKFLTNKFRNHFNKCLNFEEIKGCGVSTASLTILAV